MKLKIPDKIIRIFKYFSRFSIYFEKNGLWKQKKSVFKKILNNK